MGYIRHNAIIVTSWDDEKIELAHAMAKTLGNVVTDIVGPTTNGYCTFTIVPDGSKEGWARSHEGDDARESFRVWLNKQRYEDGSTSLEWVEVAYGNDDRRGVVVWSAW